MAYYRGAFMWQLQMAAVAILFPICLVIAAFSGCDIRQRGNKHACRDGAADKCIEVGKFYEARTDGLIATMLSNAVTAEDYYDRACKLNSADGCARLGHMVVAVMFYDSIRDSHVTHHQGMKALAKACDGGIKTACHELADASEPADAAPVLAKLCDAGDKPGCDKLVTAYLATAPKRAADLLGKLCDAGDDDHCRELGRAFLKGSKYYDADPPRGVALLQKACDRGASGACRELGEAYADGTLTADPAKSAELLAKSCGQDDPDACFDAAKAIVDTDTAKAIALFKDSCDKGDMRGCDALGDIARVGTATSPRDIQRAFELYDASCRRGNDFSCYKRDCIGKNSDSDACMKVWRLQKEYVYKLGGRFDMR